MIIIIGLVILAFLLWILSGYLKDLENHWEVMEEKEEHVTQEVTKNVQINNKYIGDNLTIKDNIKK